MLISSEISLHDYAYDDGSFSALGVGDQPLSLSSWDCKLSIG